MKVVLYGTFFLFMMSGVANAQDNEIFTCMNRSGKLTVIGDADSKREECRRREVLRSWNQQGPEGPKGEQGVQGEPGSQGTPGMNIHLTDALGRDLGVFVGVDSFSNKGTLRYNVILDGYGLNIHQNPDSKTVSVNYPLVNILFSGPNCTGTPLSHEGITPQQIKCAGNRCFRLPVAPRVGWRWESSINSSGVCVNFALQPLALLNVYEEVLSPLSFQPEYPVMFEVR